MKMPPFLLGITLVFWGWQTGISVWMLALPMGVIFECARLVKWRWQLDTSVFKRLANITLLVIIILYPLVFFKSLTFIYTMIKIFPIIFFPLLIAQTYSTQEAIDIRALFLFKSQGKTDNNPFFVDLTYPYLFICLLAASTGNTQNLYFYLGMILILTVLFWQSRCSRFSPIIWFILLLIAVFLGLILSSGFYKLQGKIEESIAHLLTGFYLQEVDPLQTNTAIGELGRLKQSNEIIFRLRSNNQQTIPQRIRQATYNLYIPSFWLADQSIFTPVATTNQGTSWHLAKTSKNASEVTIFYQIKQQNGLLKLPLGTFKVNKLPVLNMWKNQYGTVKIESTPTLLSYQVLFNPALSWDSLPTQNDLKVPITEKLAIEKIVRELILKSKTEREKVREIEDFFAKNFTYSLQFTDNEGKPKSLSNFLLKNRSGHCEYFATATTLLLRAAGLPARYAVGYAIEEFSPLENQYIVRSRHAHAWTLVYLDGRWQELDTTPADWASLEQQGTPFWTIFSDLGSFVQFKLAQGWQWGQTNPFVKYGVWLIPLLFLLRQNKFLRQISSRVVIIQKHQSAIAYQKEDSSDFSLIEKRLNQQGFYRMPSETAKQWLKRLKNSTNYPGDLDKLSPILELYYRARFDPQGITPTQQTQLTDLLKSWLGER